ncbi:hypothetical protein ACZ90_22705 [Streptomyces albus subsp. albus]|nr:hypothetical protein ACZ90_22705 [Streptomyces albus subsp. albus]
MANTATGTANALDGGPSTQDEEERERRATWFELFCDLVFVAAVGQVVHRIGSAPTAASVAAACGLFVPVWWTWVLYAIRANRLDPDDTVHRLLTMTGMAGVCGMAVFAGQVGHGTAQDAGFALSHLAARWMVAVLYAWAARGDARFGRAARSFAAGSAVSSALWLGGLAAPEGPVRWALWAAGMAVELGLPFAVGRHTSTMPGDADHLRERFGLFTIIVLGEIVLGFTGGLSHARLEPVAALTGLSAFALCACLWWTYFNASSTRAESHTQIATRPRLRHAYVFGHLPLQCGLAVAGGVLGTVVSGGTERLPLSAAACLAGGIAVFLTAGALVRAAFTGLREGVVRIRLGVAAAVLGIIPAARALPAAALPALAAAVLAAGVLVESPVHHHRRRQGGSAVS